METVTQKKSKVENLVEAAQNLGLSFQTVLDESGEVVAVLIGEPSYVESVSLEELFKSKEVH